MILSGTFRYYYRRILIQLHSFHESIKRIEKWIKSGDRRPEIRCQRFEPWESAVSYGSNFAQQDSPVLSRLN